MRLGLNHEFLDETSLLGPKERIAERMKAYAAGVTTLNVAVPASDLHTRRGTLLAAVAALDIAGVGE